MISKNSLESGDGSINNQGNGAQTVVKDNLSVNTQIQQLILMQNHEHNYFKLAQEELNALITPIIATEIEKLSEPIITDLVKRKITKLGFEYTANSIDMEKNIKEIYQKCFKICAYKLQDENKYKVIFNLIGIIRKISYSEIKEFKSLVNHQEEVNNAFPFRRAYGQGDFILPISNYAPISSIVLRLKNLGLLYSEIDQPATSKLLASNSPWHKIEMLYALSLEGILLKEILKYQNELSSCHFDITEDKIVSIIQKFDAFF